MKMAQTICESWSTLRAVFKQTWISIRYQKRHNWWSFSKADFLIESRIITVFIRKISKHNKTANLDKLIDHSHCSSGSNCFTNPVFTHVYAWERFNTLKWQAKASHNDAVLWNYMRTAKNQIFKLPKRLRMNEKRTIFFCFLPPPIWVFPLLAWRSFLIMSSAMIRMIWYSKESIPNLDSR